MPMSVVNEMKFNIADPPLAFSSAEFDQGLRLAWVPAPGAPSRTQPARRCSGRRGCARSSSTAPNWRRSSVSIWVADAIRPSGKTPVDLIDPLIALPGPEAVAVSSLGIKDPRLDLLGKRVPADALIDRHHRLALHVDREIAEQEVLVR